jgi:DnaJ-class molecular chaperone
MAKDDYYNTLGVDRDVDEKALKGAFRKLAMKYHPDRNPDNADAETKFKEINEAYEVLKDPEKRAAYDRYGHAAFEQGGPGAGGGGFGGGGFSGFGDIFEEMFGDMMGGGRGQSSMVAGSFAPSKASSRSNAPVPPAMAPGQSFRIRAVYVAGQVASVNPKPCP